MLKVVYKQFAYNECSDFADYLEQMAAKGWHLKEWKAGLVFEKGEPEKAEYAVDVFIKGTEYDTKPEPDTKEFAEYYEAAGWKLIEAKRKFCIFKKCRADAAETMMEEERFEIIRKEMYQLYSSQFMLAAVISLMRWVQFLTFDFQDEVFRNEALIILMIFPVLAMICLARLISHFKWVYDCKKKLQMGEKIFYRKQRDWYRWATILIAGLWMMLLIIMKEYSLVALVSCVIVIGLLMSYFIDRFRPSQSLNRIIHLFLSMLLVVVIIVFVAGSFSEERKTAKIMEPPLWVEDYKDVEGDLREKTVKQDTSILGNSVHCYLQYDDETIFYDLYESEYTWVIDRLWKEESTFFKNAADCSESWEAKEALRAPAMYLIRYDSKILLIASGELTQEQIEIVRDKLNL